MQFRKIQILIIIFFIPFFLSAQLSFTEQDLAVSDRRLWEKTYSDLTAMLEKTTDITDRGEILWRISRLACIIGDSTETTKEKRIWYQNGINAAQTGITENPDNHLCYMWHCANKGRDMQTRSLMTQSSGVSVLLDDLSQILNRLNHTEMSEAWQALGEIYLNHPFKSTSAAVSFFRKAVDTIPENEVRIPTYKSLADALHSRNWSAAKRRTELAKQQNTWVQEYGNNTDNISLHENYEGKTGSSYSPAWTEKNLGELSDRQEEQLILEYAKALYLNIEVPSDSDTEAYNAILKKLK